MRRIPRLGFFVWGCAAAILPAFASAISLRIPNVALRPGETTPVEAVFDEAGAADEKLLAYTIGLRIFPVGSADPAAVTFAAPWAALTETAPPVFPGAAPTLITQDPLHISAARDISGAEDINNGEGLIRFYLHLNAPLTLGTGYTIVFDPDEASFGSTDPAYGDGIPVTLQNASVIVIPDPVAVPILVVAGALAARQRRRS